MNSDHEERGHEGRLIVVLFCVVAWTIIANGLAALVAMWRAGGLG